MWHCLTGNDGMDTVKADLSEVLKLSDGMEKERQFTTSKCMTEQVNGLPCREFVNTAGKPGSFCSYERVGFWIREAQGKCAL